MSGRLDDITSAVDVTLPVPDGARFVWVINSGAGPINVSPGAGASLVDGVASYALPAGRSLFCDYHCGGAFWQVREER